MTRRIKGLCKAVASVDLRLDTKESQEMRPVGTQKLGGVDGLWDLLKERQHLEEEIRKTADHCYSGNFHPKLL